MIKLDYNPQNKSHAQDLRKNMTPQEKHLWYDFLATYPVRFRRQKQFGNYIVDFYCAKAGLVIELDGGQHYEDQGIEYDRKRTQYLEKLGLKVIRFSNLDIDRNFSGVCEEIDGIIKGHD